jgi:lipopolysaccharide transport system ATP-binding protein
MSTAIQVTNLSKLYRLGEIGTGTISRDLERWFKMRIRGQEDPFLKIGETKTLTFKT